MTSYIGIEEANMMICDLYEKNDLCPISNSFRWFLKYRKEKTITIQDVTLEWKTIGRKICVEENELQQKIDKTIKKLQKAKLLKENGTLEQRADKICGQFVAFYQIEHPGDEWTDYICRKCEKQAKTKNEKEECYRCSDWNSCGKDCTLSHLICESCGITQSM